MSKISSGTKCSVNVDWDTSLKTRTCKVLRRRSDGMYHIQWLGKSRFTDTADEKYGTLFAEHELIPIDNKE